MSRNTPDPVAVLRGHHAEVQALGFLDDEGALLAGDAEGEVRVWDLQDMRPATSWRAHPVSGGVLGLQAFSWQGQSFVVTQGKDMTISIWRLGSDLQPPRDPLHIIHKLASSFCRISLLAPPEDRPLGGNSSFGSGGGQATDAPVEGTSSRQETAGGGACSAVATCIPMAASSGLASAEELASSGSNDVEPTGVQGECSRSLAAAAAGRSVGPSASLLPHGCEAAAAAGGAACSPLPPPPHLLALPADDNASVEVWCCGCGRRLAVVGQPSAWPEGPKLGMCTALKLFSSPGSGAPCLAAGYEAGWVVVWAVSRSVDGISGGSVGSEAAGVGQGRPLAARQLHQEPVLALDVGGTGAGGASGGADSRLVLFKLDLAAGAIKVRKAVPLKAPGVNELAIRGDGRLVAAAGWDGRVRMFSYRTGEPLAVLKYHWSAVAAVQFSPSTHLLASGSRDGTIALWSIYQPQQPGPSS